MDLGAQDSVHLEVSGAHGVLQDRGRRVLGRIGGGGMNVRAQLGLVGPQGTGIRLHRGLLGQHAARQLRPLSRLLQRLRVEVRRVSLPVRLLG